MLIESNTPTRPSTSCAVRMSKIAIVAPAMLLASPKPADPTSRKSCGPVVVTMRTWSPSRNPPASNELASTTTSSGPAGAAPWRRSKMENSGSSLHDVPNDGAPATPTRSPSASTMSAPSTNTVPSTASTPGTSPTAPSSDSGTGSRTASRPSSLVRRTLRSTVENACAKMRSNRCVTVSVST